MTALGTLPTAHIAATAHTSGNLIHVRLSNPSKALAFQVAAELEDEHGAKLPQTTWTDNYIELMPGEERELTASIPSDTIASASSKEAAELKVKIEGWNTTAVTIPSRPIK
jgi:hypothetical protein